MIPFVLLKNSGENNVENDAEPHGDLIGKLVLQSMQEIIKT